MFCQVSMFIRVAAAVILISLIYFNNAQETTRNDDYYDKVNTVDPTPSVRLDPYIRKALLKALSDLEEGNNVTDFETTDGTSNTNTDRLTAEDDLSVTQANKESIQIHSFLVNGQSAFANSSNTSPTYIDNNISIISSTVGNVENHVTATATLPTQTPFSEIFQAKESGINVQQVRSIQSNPKKSIANGEKINQPVYRPKTISSTTTTSTTTTTTTTTTPKPTHNEDGENIEDVDKKDVQVFQAPLVAAFTVQQDANGIPKRVIPIYQQTNNGIPQAANLPTNILLPELLPPKPTPSSFLNAPSNDFISQHLTLQKQLEEKQRLLEEQLRFLQFQQRQQEELLRNQQILLQQKEAQRQQSLFEQEQLKRQQLVAEQQKVSRLNSNFPTHKHIPQNPIVNNGLRPQKSHVSIHPSVVLDNPNNLAGQQQLPNKEAVDFLLHLRKQQSDQFPLQENHLPQGIGNFLQPNPPQHNRVFRHESGVGNLGVNFNNFDHGFSHRFFPINQFGSDSELKQLLSQTSLHPRAHEDLNIVTKVLSLNHGIPISNNRLQFDSRRHTRPLK
ncbi:hypothetical protein KGM_202017 [Danaus plexippus plexippus]|uniref:Transcription factor SPT20 homolog n=1 Tax=Danaus plexippus plexippus TaxID=278856 RepID=A0A212EZ60_DANPL|nr:hypothetical protein KGM_202017 [Danaus plexippus plexippus]